MAKKSAAKKRKGATAKPKTTDIDNQILGTVTIPVLTTIDVNGAVNFNELVIEWGCLGLSEEPDQIRETSGNSHMLDPAHPPITSEEGLHVFFKPPLTGGTYGFQFAFVYLDAVEARTADPEKVKELEKARDEAATKEAA